MKRYKEELSAWAADSLSTHGYRMGRLHPPHANPTCWSSGRSSTKMWASFGASIPLASPAPPISITCTQGYEAQASPFMNPHDPPMHHLCSFLGHGLAPIIVFQECSFDHHLLTAGREVAWVVTILRSFSRFS